MQLGNNYCVIIIIIIIIIINFVDIGKFYWNL